MTPQQEQLLKKYAEAVMSAPPHLHLTADRNPDLFWKRHVQDAVELLRIIPPFSSGHSPLKVIDIGTGNGIPGIVSAILEPTWEVCLLDSDNKKCGFLDMFCNKNLLTNVHIVVGRAESLAHSEMREDFDLTFARALGKLRVAVELSGAFVRIGGLLIVPHGTSWECELEKSKEAILKLGLKYDEAVKYGQSEQGFFALKFRKAEPTPESYPRGIGKPSKRPL